MDCGIFLIQFASCLIKNCYDQIPKFNEDELRFNIANEILILLEKNQNITDVLIDIK